MVHTDGTNEILVTAATWYIGGQTIEAIKKMNPNATVVAGVYEKSKKIDHREMWNDADGEHQFDANNPQTLNFDRFNVVCIIPSTNSGRLVQFSHMLDECKRCSSHPFVVFCSVADTFGYDGDFAKSTRHMEAMLETSGLQYVIINCGFFHQNFEWSADDMKNKHKIRLPIGKGSFAPVDARDVARLIGTVMKDPDHYEGNRFGMVGNQLIGGEGAALIASQALGYSIEFEDIPETVYFNDLQNQGCSPGMARSLCELCVIIRKHDLERTISGPLLVKLHNRTIKLKEYFENYAGLYETTTEEVQEEETERENVTDFDQPGEWGDLSKADEGYAERKEEETYPSPEFGEGREPAQYGREEREDWKQEAERGRREGWKVRKVIRGREEEEETARSPPPVEEERVVAIERDVYYLKPETNKRVDVLRKAQRDYEELLALLSDTIDDWNGILKEHRASFRAEEGLLEKLEDRRSEIHQALRDLDNEIREQERGKDRPLVASSMPPITKGMHLVSRHDEKLEGGTRHVERYESRDRERDYERYSQRDETRYPEEHRFAKERRYPEERRYSEERRYPEERRRYPEERRRYPEERTYSEERRYPEERMYYTEEHRYPEERREYRSRSGMHLGRELDRGRYSTKLGRELQTYKGDNFIARISHILYGWKDKGDQEDRSRSRSRDVERGDRYYRGEMEYGEPRRESERLDRDYETRGRRDLDRQYERRQREQDRDEEYRRVESERLDREYEERRRLDYERKPEPRRPSREKEEEFGPDDRDNELRREYERKKREYEMERPKSYEESQPESTKRGSFRGAHGEEERIEPKHRTARRRESGYASESEEYVLIPKRLIQEAISY